MRTWGRVYPQDGSGPFWQEVTTDANGSNDAVWLTTLAQVLLLNLGESPFYGNFGIPAQQTILTQVLPDYYVTVTQQQFAPFFASLIISRTSANPPTYRLNVVTHQGVYLDPNVAVPA